MFWHASLSVIEKPMVARVSRPEPLVEDGRRALLDVADDLVHVAGLRHRRDLEQHARLARRTAARHGRVIS
jgi:hypothetical protein